MTVRTIHEVTLSLHSCLSFTHWGSTCRRVGGSRTRVSVPSQVGLCLAKGRGPACELCISQRSLSICPVTCLKTSQVPQLPLPALGCHWEEGQGLFPWCQAEVIGED